MTFKAEWGETPLANPGFFDVSMLMSSRQFKSNYRIDKATFLWVERRLWHQHTQGYTPVGAKRKRPVVE